MQDNETSSTSNKSEFDRELQYAFLKFVEDIEDRSFVHRDFTGICANFWLYLKYEIDDRVNTFLKQIFPLWDKFSGDVKFPIKGGSQMYYDVGDTFAKMGQISRVR